MLWERRLLKESLPKAGSEKLFPSIPQPPLNHLPVKVSELSGPLVTAGASVRLDTPNNIPISPIHANVDKSEIADLFQNANAHSPYDGKVWPGMEHVQIGDWVQILAERKKLNRNNEVVCDKEYSIWEPIHNN